MQKLNGRQDAFVKAYLLNGGNATKAALKAGYSDKTASEMGHENLNKPHIKKAIDEHQKGVNKAFIMSKQDKLKKLEEILNCATGADSDKGMINMQSAIAAIKEHNLMQGDNAPTQVESHVVIDDGNNEW